MHMGIFFNLIPINIIMKYYTDKQKIMVPLRSIILFLLFMTVLPAVSATGSADVASDPFSVPADGGISGFSGDFDDSDVFEFSDESDESASSADPDVSDSSGGSGLSEDDDSSGSSLQYVPGRVIVRFDPDHMPESSDDVIMSFDDLVPGLLVIRLPDDLSVGEAVSYYEKQPGVLYAEPDYYLEPVFPEVPDESGRNAPEETLLRSPELSGNSDDGLRGSAGHPSDPLFVYQWALNNTGQRLPAAGSVTTNGTSIPLSSISGTPGADIRVIGAWNYYTYGDPDIIVAVLDSGILLTHPDLVDSIYVNSGEIPGNGIDDDNNGYIDDVNGWDFISNDNNPTDENGHGTHCAGAIAAAMNDYGTVGVAPNVTILPLRMLDKKTAGTYTAELAAIQYAESAGARIVSGSYGSAAYHQAEYDAIKNSSMLFVMASGNTGRNESDYPGGYDLPNIICIGATDYNDELCSFSNYNESSVDLCAPGSLILSDCTGTGINGAKTTWETMNGTSMSVPLVSGTAALMLSVNPSLNASQMRTILMESSDFIPSTLGKTTSAGRVNATRAVHNANKTANGTLTFSVRDTSGDLTVRENETAVFYVRIEGSQAGNVSYIWETYNGSGWEIISSGRNYYQIKAQKSDDGKQIRCSVTDHDGRKNKIAKMNLTVISVYPEVISQPENVSVPDGENASFSVSAAGVNNGSVSFVWQKKSGSTWGNISSPDVNETQTGDLYTSVITLSNTTYKNDGLYRCIVSNENGTVYSSEARLTVVRTISFVSEYGTVPESIQVTGSSPTVTIPSDFPEYPGMTFLCWQNTETGRTYEPGKKYSFTTSATLEAVMTSNLVPPEIVSQDGSVYVPESSSGILMVNVTDVTSAGTSFRWEYYSVSDDRWKTVPTPSTGKISKTESGNVTYFTSAYTTANTSYRSGNIIYRCVVSNIEGETTSQNVTVYVTHSLVYTTDHGTAPSPTLVICPEINATVTSEYPVCPGYVFVNWVDNSGNTYIIGDIIVTGKNATTLYADMKPVNITFSQDPSRNIQELIDHLTNGSPIALSDPETYDLNQDGRIDGIDLILLEKYVCSVTLSEEPAPSEEPVSADPSPSDVPVSSPDPTPSDVPVSSPDPTPSDIPSDTFSVSYAGLDYVPPAVTVEAGAEYTVSEDRAVSPGKIFLGWVSGNSQYTAGDRLIVTENIVFDAVWYTPGIDPTGADVINLKQALHDDDPDQYTDYDMNGDGRVTITDLVLMSQYVADKASLI